MNYFLIILLRMSPMFLIQIARVLHLMYRLVVQPNTSRAQMFAEAFLACGGIETLLVLLQREAKACDYSVPETVTASDENLSVQRPEVDCGSGVLERSCGDVASMEEKESVSHEKDFDSHPLESGISPVAFSPSVKIERMASASENPLIKNLGGINLSISADNARNNVYNSDKSDGIVVGIIGLLGALVASGYLKVGSGGSSDMTSNIFGSGLHDGGGTMFDDKVSLLLYALQKAFQAAPNRLMTGNVYTALLGASVWL
jgi:hypothetical protein